MNKVIRTIEELFKLSNCEIENHGHSFYVKSKEFVNSRNNAEHYCNSKDDKYHLTFYCDTRDKKCYETIEFYQNVINNLLTKLTKKESEEKTMAIKIEKVKEIQNRINKLESILANIDFSEADLAEEQAREEYLEEQQARLDAATEASLPVEEQTANTSIEKLFKGLYEFTPDFETWSENISNSVCSENISDIMQSNRMTKETLEYLLRMLEVPYKMWRRIDAYLKRHSESE